MQNHQSQHHVSMNNQQPIDMHYNGLVQSVETEKEFIGRDTVNGYVHTYPEKAKNNIYQLHHDNSDQQFLSHSKSQDLYLPQTLLQQRNSNISVGLNPNMGPSITQAQNHWVLANDTNRIDSFTPHTASAIMNEKSQDHSFETQLSQIRQSDGSYIPTSSKNQKMSDSSSSDERNISVPISPCKSTNIEDNSLSFQVGNLQSNDRISRNTLSQSYNSPNIVTGSENPKLEQQPHPQTRSKGSSVTAENMVPIGYNVNPSVTPTSTASNFNTGINSRLNQTIPPNQHVVPPNVQGNTVPGAIPYPQPSSGLSEEIKRSLSNIAIVRFLRFKDLLICRHEKPNLPYLTQVVNDFFVPDACIKLKMKTDADEKCFTFAYNLLPLLYHKYLANIQMLEISHKFLNAIVLDDLSSIVQTDHISAKCVFEDGSYSNFFGSMKIKMNKSLMFEEIDILTDYNVQGVEFSALDKFMSDFQLHNKTNPSIFDIKLHFKQAASLSKHGLTDQFLKLLQVSEAMTLSKPLLNHFIQSKSNSLSDSLKEFNQINFAGFQRLQSLCTKVSTGINQRVLQETHSLQSFTSGAQVPAQVKISCVSAPATVQNGDDGYQTGNGLGHDISNYSAYGVRPLKRAPSDDNTQIVPKSSQKKLKLQIPAPPKVSKKRKESDKAKKPKADYKSMNKENSTIK